MHLLSGNKLTLVFTWLQLVLINMERLRLLRGSSCPLLRLDCLPLSRTDQLVHGSIVLETYAGNLVLVPFSLESLHSVPLNNAFSAHYSRVASYGLWALSDTF